MIILRSFMAELMADLEGVIYFCELIVLIAGTCTHVMQLHDRIVISSLFQFATNMSIIINATKGYNVAIPLIQNTEFKNSIDSHEFLYLPLYLPQNHISFKLYHKSYKEPLSDIIQEQEVMSYTRDSKYNYKNNNNKLMGIS